MTVFKRPALPALSLVLSVCLLAWSASVGTADAATDVKPRLTQAQAIGIAQTFCQKIGEPVAVAGSAQFPAPNKIVGQPNHYWQARWRVTFPQQAELEVTDAGGVIASYVNEAVYDEDLAKRNQPLGTPLSRAQALKQAEAALLDSGLSGGLSSSPVTSYDIQSIPPKYGSRRWYIAWLREWHDIPYAEEGAGAVVDADSGKIRRFGVDFVSPPPTNAPLVATHEQAGASARAHMAAAGLADAVLISANPRMVTSAELRDMGVGGRSTGLLSAQEPAQVAYMCAFAISGHSYLVMVDAQDNHVIGHVELVSRGNGKSLPAQKRRPDKPKSRAKTR